PPSAPDDVSALQPVPRPEVAPPSPQVALPRPPVERLEVRPGVPPGSSATAPPPPPSAASGEAPATAGGTPSFPLDAGVRFPLTGPGIRAAVQDAKADIQHCYEAWSKVSPSLGGRLVIGFRISGDGGPEATVDRVRLTEDAGMGNAAFEGCVLSVMSDLRFDAPPSGDLEVTYPFIFSNDAGS
ncbi:MAG: AgmX/PglI C-terminal domain-containing protein, partial [Myxococcaceae bacterium]|nr:AgmX/PglI C-terminal domain-containing protein [Myxococcaceae bacterium]